MKILKELGIECLPKVNMTRIIEDGDAYYFAHIYRNQSPIPTSIFAFTYDSLVEQLERIHGIKVERQDRTLDNFITWYNRIAGPIQFEKMGRVCDRFNFKDN